MGFDGDDVHLPAEATFFSYGEKEAPKVPWEIVVGEPVLTSWLESVKLMYQDGREAAVPNEQSQMTYYLRKTHLAGGGTLEALLSSAPMGDVQLNESRTATLPLEPPQAINPPDRFFFPAGTVTAINYTYTGRMGRALSGNVMIDPGALAGQVVYTNVLTGEATRFALETLPLGDGKLIEGKFYFTYYPLAYFYCSKIEDSNVTLHMVESFQNGRFCQAITSQDIKYSSLYIPVTDRKTLARLRSRLDRLMARSSSGDEVRQPGKSSRS